MDNGLDSILAKSGSLPPSAFTVQRQSIIQPGADTLVHFEPSLGAGIPDSGLDWDLHYNFSGSFHLDDPKPGSSHVQNLDDWWSREVTQTISDVPIGGQEGQYQAVEDWWNREAAQTVPESRKGSQKGQHEAVDDWWNREVTQMDSEPVRAQEGQDEAVDDVPPNVTVEKPSRSKLSPHAKRVLENFFRIELYPDMKETETIARVAEMTFKQVRQWFRNKRRRTTPDGMSKAFLRVDETDDC